MKYRIEIEYSGGRYVGWQKQKTGLSVQEALSGALSKLCGERAEFFAAGRTDAGVHALRMTAHFETAKKIPLRNILMGMNFHLGKAGEDIAILRARRAADDFHARFSCTGREYLYRILDRISPSPIQSGGVWHARKKLDVKAMREAADFLVGRHDFTSFRASECQAKSPVKTLDSLRVSRRGELIEIRACAKSFLHHQVRNIAGTLKLVG